MKPVTRYEIRRLRPIGRRYLKTPEGVLRNAIRILEERGRWCRGAYFRDREGSVCEDHQAVQCCAIGAIYISAARPDIAERVNDLFLRGAPLSTLNERRGGRHAVLQRMKSKLEQITRRAA